MHQHTLQSPVTFIGVGIHSGKPVTVICQPALPFSGIQFFRSDLNRAVPVLPDSLSHTARATALSKDGVSIKTPEHLLSALYGLQIDNVRIEISGEEVPILDGSSWPFVEAFLKAGIVQSAEVAPVYRVTSPVAVHLQGSVAMALPYDGFKISYYLEYDHPLIGYQIFSDEMSPETYQRISPARTFGFLAEVEQLKARGLAMGGSLDNALVIGETGYLTPLRFPDELVCHKVLDLVGDLSILGKRIQGHIVSIKSGHALNGMLVQRLAKTVSSSVIKT